MDNRVRITNISLKIEYDLVLRVDAYAIMHNMSRSEVVRKAIEEFLQRHQDEKLQFRVEKELRR